MANYLYETFLKPIASLVDENKDLEAIERYRIMTLALINYYGIKKVYNENGIQIDSMGYDTLTNAEMIRLYNMFM